MKDKILSSRLDVEVSDEASIQYRLEDLKLYKKKQYISRSTDVPSSLLCTTNYSIHGDFSEMTFDLTKAKWGAKGNLRTEVSPGPTGLLYVVKLLNGAKWNSVSSCSRDVVARSPQGVARGKTFFWIFPSCHACVRRAWHIAARHLRVFTPPFVRGKHMGLYIRIYNRWKMVDIVLFYGGSCKKG